MTPEALTPERILEATEDVLRRYGPAKATVVDVARVLGVSHGSVYRHFRTKAALREAVTERWLHRSEAELARFADDREGSATARLTNWLTALFAAKRRKAGGDPELFATFGVLTGESSGVVESHIGALVGQLARIIEDGCAQGEFAPVEVDFPTTARAVFDATGRFHDPVYAAEWSRPGIDGDFTAVQNLLLGGLRAR
ncbi:TetR/AcrR family transcriptional regulator [Streptomyces sp. NPDC090052]|uniref:TetR/AcrR family transcriptional regulator n=1 Tax=unclassified Streptomyces TaxID=2593676 RepID=UPI002257D438|nr:MULTISPECIES: TetR family transcriptional regulator [unclassified Streptomyces]MCX4726704.1 TetR family transcriptional regulator [Streptomyces sp. NBC_01306]WSV03993.1 TetR family transcriptional regulator [Streptomyces sp. NBC_01020]WSX42054.1 TetR family transcriptional regulator [Streptomyces sp. NBC_00963]WSX69895.1 TetR family transcriptional regulator [Streptomyces sp. NBC_00932]